MRRGRLWSAVAGLALVGLELTPLHEPHAHEWWHHLPGFDLVYGVVGCVLIIVISKKLGSAWLQRPESFYGDRPS